MKNNFENPKTARHKLIKEAATKNNISNTKFEPFHHEAQQDITELDPLLPCEFGNTHSILIATYRV